jgi:hypothetical protein
VKGTRGFFCRVVRLTVSLFINLTFKRSLEGMHSLQHLRVAIRLRDKQASGGYFIAARRPHAGRDDDVHRRPAVSYGGGQFQSVHGTRQIYVREDRVNVVARFEDFDRIVGVCHSDNVVALVFQGFADVQAEKEFVFDDKDQMSAP